MTERGIVLHADDVGMCHGANVAFLELARAGRIDCGSVMVPCPWFPEIAEAAAADASLDLGVHLTLTSEWPRYRWGPVSTRSPASGLIDGDGYLWRDVPSLRRAVVPEAAAEELEAQIARALAGGIDVTHLDTHMGAALVPELAAVYLDLGRRHRLPVLLPRDFGSYLDVLRMGEVDQAAYAAAAESLAEASWPVFDRFLMTPGAASDQALEAYEALLASAGPGMTFVSLHPNAPGDIEAITATHPRARPEWRTDEYRLFGGGLLEPAIARAGLRRSGMRALRDAWRARHAATGPAGS